MEAPDPKDGQCRVEYGPGFKSHASSIIRKLFLKYFNLPENSPRRAIRNRWLFRIKGSKKAMLTRNGYTEENEKDISVSQVAHKAQPDPSSTRPHS